MFIQPYVRWFLLHSMIPVGFGVVFGIWLGRRNSRASARRVLLISIAAGVIDFLIVWLTGIDELGAAFRHSLYFWAAGAVAFMVARTRERPIDGLW